MLDALWKGTSLGFCIAAPLGPIGTIVLKNSVRHGVRAGLASGFGAALADLLFGILAVTGVRFATAYERPMGIAGGLFLLLLAWRSWQDSRKASGQTLSPGLHGDAGATLAKSTLTTFAFTISNPMTILSFAAMVAVAGSSGPGYFVTGVFTGSMLWWVILSTGAGWAGSRIQGPFLHQVTAFILACFGVWALWTKGLAVQK